MKDLFTVGRAIGMLQCGKSQSFVANVLNVSRKSVRRWYACFLRDGAVVRRKSTGRPQKTTQRSNNLLRLLAISNRFASCPLLLRLWGEHVSLFTIRRRLGTFGFKQYRSPLKPFLSPDNRIRRYQWAQNHVFWPINRFFKVVWSDESRFRLLVNDGRVKVWRTRGEDRYRNDLVVRMTQAGGGSVHVWGAIWHDGRSQLQILRQTVNGERYCQIIQTFLDEGRVPNGDWTLQHDNAPAHQSRLVKDFLTNSQVQVMPWPSRSPDLNPIGRRARLRNPINLNQLTDFLVQEWERIPQCYLMSLVESMRRRITAVIQSNGGTTKY